MREILFRGKRADNKWIYGDLLNWYDTNNNNQYNPCIIPIECSVKGKSIRDFVVVPETIGQYTGLDDKYGKKIFEGDIVISSYNEDQENIVKFDEDRCGYYPFATGDGCGCCENNVFPPYTCEVIGNIYDKEN